MRDKCELCNGTGWYGDNGPGIRGNSEYHPCDGCERGRFVHGDTVDEVVRQLTAANERADRAEAERDELAADYAQQVDKVNELAARLRAVREAIDFDMFEAASGRDHHIGIERAKRARTALSGPVPECPTCKRLGTNKTWPRHAADEGGGHE